ncbi:glycosyltransferase [Cavenderia fasciculata]|uniref:Mannosyltransferase n=1 Tax=Cavenderia fasciculata TaxID=261658 RepID=F4Q6P8_CACFS|nr:glycosyltransferase [Cavenderia fasciculata]EGG16558.1 glycosyltransferase [Cavenderia fasciculata]|eukprot:XP_004354958.1 glycosyltransferase [Cavenderia fasciculata]
MKKDKKNNNSSSSSKPTTTTTTTTTSPSSSTLRKRHVTGINILEQLPLSYFICLLVRLIIGISSIGYIHPDEYFQSPEITASDIFNFDTFRAWEYDPTNPCRSIIVPMINSAIPYFTFKKGTIIIRDFNGYTLFVMPRLFAVFSSVLLDYYVCLLCRHYRLSFQKALSVLSSCWLIIIFHSRTFSNTIESLTVATLLTIVLLQDGKGYKYIENLALHGIHNRLTHLFASLPLMIGPLIIVLTIEIISIIRNYNSNSNSKSNQPTTNNNNNNNNNNSNNNSESGNGSSEQTVNMNGDYLLPWSVRLTIVGVIMSGLFFLSLAPHQEARFLLPIFFPCVLVCFRYFYMPTKRSKYLVIVWILFNMLATIFYGFIHQAGVVPSLIHLQGRISNNNVNNSISSSSSSPHFVDIDPNQKLNIIYFHTYMAPRHLLGIGADQKDRIKVYDVSGDFSKLSTLMDSFNDNSHTIVLTPNKKILYEQFRHKTCQLVDSFWPHITTEDLPDSLYNLRLFLLSCHEI